MEKFEVLVRKSEDGRYALDLKIDRYDESIDDLTSYEEAKDIAVKWLVACAEKFLDLADEIGDSDVC